MRLPDQHGKGDRVGKIGSSASALTQSPNELRNQFSSFYRGLKKGLSARLPHTMLRAAVCICLWASAADAFMAMPSTATSAFAPAVGKRSMSLAKSGSSVGNRMAPALGSSPLRSKPTITNLAMGKVKAEYVWIGGRGGVGDDYR